MKISDEAVEAAKGRLIEEFAVSWDEGEYGATAVWGTPAEIVRAALEVAVPLVLAGAKDEAFIAGVRVGIKKQAEYERGQSLLSTNPRRGQP